MNFGILSGLPSPFWANASKDVVMENQWNVLAQKINQSQFSRENLGGKEKDTNRSGWQQWARTNKFLSVEHNEVKGFKHRRESFFGGEGASNSAV